MKLSIDCSCSRGGSAMFCECRSYDSMALAVMLSDAPTATRTARLADLSRRAGGCCPECDSVNVEDGIGRERRCEDCGECFEQ